MYFFIGWESLKFWHCGNLSIAFIMLYIVQKWFSCSEKKIVFVNIQLFTIVCSSYVSNLCGRDVESELMKNEDDDDIVDIL